MTATQIHAKASVEKLGGSFEWVDEDDKRVLALDIDNKGKVFHFGCLSQLPMLNAVRVFQGSINENSIKNLESVSNLHLLVILSDGLTDAGCKALGRLKQVDKLDVKSRTMTGTGVRELAKIKSLRRLFLYNSELKDKDIDPLGEMTWLQELVLPLTVSQERCDSLAKRLPKLDIRRM